ncbi:MAG: zinc metalloprotease HtpX [Mucispirillum sp.]|nr:zinc metalloprotease HtpX [Mucispirillum sp.]
MTTVNTLKTVFLITLMTVLLVFIGNLIGGKTGMIIALVFAVGMNFFSYWFSDKIVLKMYKAEEVDEAGNPRLYRIVRTLATRAGLPMPKVYIIMNGSPNAFATGRNKNHAAVAVTNTLMDMLDDDELAGVIGHELAHIYGKDILIGTIVAMMAGTIMTIVDIFQWSMILGGGSSDDDGSPLGFAGSIAMIILAPLAATLIQMAVSRSREYIADQRGAQFCGNPRALASALHKIAYGIQMHPMNEAKPATAHMFIESPFSGQKMMSLFSTHPAVDDRIEKLMAMANTRSGRAY